MDDILQQIAASLYDGNCARVSELVQKALDGDTEPSDILGEGLLLGMSRVSDSFKGGDLFVPEVLLSAHAMRDGMEVLRPYLSEGDVSSAGKVVVGTVKGDMHDIGKNIVRMLMEGAGFSTIDLGTDVPPESFVAAVREYQPDIVGMSALLTTTMVNMRATIEALEKAGLRASVKIIVGGAPVTSKFAKDIGADGYAPDAAVACDLAKALVSA
jgi:5-methyltetrahydrofolate--homocysteine methyltransferase